MATSVFDLAFTCAAGLFGYFVFYETWHVNVGVLSVF